MNKRHFPKGPLIGIVLAILVIFSSWVGFFRVLELKTIDWRFLLRGPLKPPDNLAIVAIDEESLGWLGNWPWPISYHSQLINILNQAGARLIGFDVLLEDPVKFGTAGERVILAGLIRPAFSPAQSVDPDGYVRKTELINSSTQSPWPSFVLQIFLKYLGGSLEDVTFSRKGGQLLFKNQIIPLGSDNRFFINFLGPEGTIFTIPYSRIIDGSFLEKNPGFFKDKIILVGITANDLQDVWPTPFSQKMSGVEIQAHSLATLLTGRFLKELNTFWEWLFLATEGLFFGFLLEIFSPLAGLFFLLVFLLLYFGINTYLFNHDFIIPLVSPVILPAGIFLGCFVCHFFSTERRKSNLKNAEEPMSPGVKKNITVLYFNLENFATFSEINEPDKVMDFLNEYFSFVRRVTEKSGGFCSRYAGCGVLAFFEISENSSSQPQLVVQAALEINKAIRKMADFSFKIETGINTGEVIVGQVGGAGPINQIAVGVEVDLAIHLGSLNRIYGTQILISESPEKFLHHEYSLVTRELDEVRIKGYQNTFKIFELLDKKSLLAAGIDLGFLAYFENGLEAYRQKNWEKAEIQFLMTLNEKPDDGPALLFIKRCRKLKNSSDLSDSWDGVSSYQNG